MTSNIYLPTLAKIIAIKDETEGERAIKTFKVQTVDGSKFGHRPGQCAMISVFGKGESMISIASSHLRDDHLDFSIMKSGRVTSAIHAMHVGDTIGLRGPLGSSFPMEEWDGKNLLIIAGGIGLAPVWPVLQTALIQHELHDEITLFYGARSSKDLVYKEDLDELKSHHRMNVNLSIDNEEPDWDGYTGFVPSNLMEKKPSPDNCIAVVCGPPIMIKFVIRNLSQLGFADKQIYTTIENKMKCGVGKCGRCNVGKDYVCTHGPVYCWSELKDLPEEY
jgi:NAD(P)H-flavin reductase